MDQLLTTGRSFSGVTIATVQYVTTHPETWITYEDTITGFPRGYLAVDIMNIPRNEVTFEQNENGAVFH